MSAKEINGDGSYLQRQPSGGNKLLGKYLNFVECTENTMNYSKPRTGTKQYMQDFSKRRIKPCPYLTFTNGTIEIYNVGDDLYATIKDVKSKDDIPDNIIQLLNIYKKK